MSQYLHGFHAGSLHDGYSSTGAQNMEDRPGWIVFTEIAGVDGGDYSLYKSWGFGVLVRLNHGYHPNGTIPEVGSYPDFAITCAQHVRNSSGVDGWIIANEPNHSQERPHDQPIWAMDYADCFRMCRDAIKAERPEAQVIVGGVAPYNVETGDFGKYLGAVLQFLGDGGYDGVALHSYTHGADPALITSPTHMGPPLEVYHYHFLVYQDMLAYIPDGVPVYITETNQNDPWTNENRGWVREMYREVNEWNEDHPNRIIRCACLFRHKDWPETEDYPTGKWTIAGKGAVIEDFKQAVDIGYTWTDTEPPEPEPPEPEPPTGGSMINPSMEIPYNQKPGYGNVMVAAGWNAWWNVGDPPMEVSQGPTVQPEYKEAPKSLDARRVREGQSAQCWFIGSKVIDGGVYQRVPAEIGKRYQYKSWAHGWCSDSNDPMACDEEMYYMVGIDPEGRTDPKSPGIVWMQWAKLTNQWQQIASRMVEAESDHITIYLRGWNKYRLRHNDWYVDDGELLVEGAPDPDPEPEPEPEPDPDPEPPDPTPTECKALTEAQVRAIVREEVRSAFEDARYTF